MKPLAFPVLLLFALFLAGCGKDGNPAAPGDDPGVDMPGVLDPIPDGVLLDGGAAEPARSFLLNLAPSAVAPADIVDGLLTTRLLALLSPGATVAEVNAALEAAGARIVSMNSTSPFVTLKIPPVADGAGAQAVAAGLTASGAFAYAGPAHQARTPPATIPTLRGGTEASQHHARMRLPQAWNVEELAIANNDKITVVIPDEYASSVPHSDIDAQSFIGFGSPNSLPGPDVYPGNNGFAVAGIVGANRDDVGTTGISPDPAALLDIDSMALGGLTWFDLFNSLAWTLASSGNRFVLYTGLEYLDPDGTIYPPLERVMHVLAWRIAAATHLGKFLHVVAEGQAGPVFAIGSATESPFLNAALFDDVRDMVDLAAVGAADSTAIETAWQDVMQQFPPATFATDNVLLVGSTFAFGPARIGGGIPSVLAQGQGIPGPCVLQDPASMPGFLCDGEVAVYGGTAMAAAQVAGLAAYLMNLSDATPTDARSALLHGYQASNTGVVDAYHAVLALDPPGGGNIRRTLLDVAGFESDESDGKFDDYDLEVLAPVLNDGGGGDSPQRVGGGGVPSLRMDLNGDGNVGGPSQARFDLNGDRSYGMVTASIEDSDVSFNENGVTDFEILCYNAYSGLYQGDLDVRTLLLGAAHGGPFLEIGGLPERLAPDTPTLITILAGVNNDGVITYLEGVSVEVDVDNGSVDSSTVVTGPGGTATATVTLDPDENELTVEVYANIGGEGAEASASVIRPDEVQILERTVNMLTEVAFGSSHHQNFWIFDNYSFYEEEGAFYAAVDTSLTDAGGTSAYGMTASGTMTATHESSVDLYDGDHFAGCSFDATVQGDMSLQNPDLDPKEHYQAQSDGYSEFEVSFVVWGESVEFNMHGEVSARYYDIELDGPDGTIFVCNTDDDPCFTISTGGTLPAGEYTLSLEIEDYTAFSESCGEPGSGCSVSGMETADSMIMLDMEIPVPAP